MMDWIKKNRDWLITLAVFLCFTLLLLLSSVLFKDSKKEEVLPIQIEEEAIFRIPDKEQPSAAENQSEPMQTTSFFLRPSASELLEKLEGLSHQELRNEQRNLPGLKIMWPAYFFSIVKMGNKKAKVMFDASQDGFGALLVTEIDIERYPQLLDLRPGTKIWLAAEIEGYDPSGTGQFHLKTEYVRFDDYKPQTKNLQPAEN